MTPNPDLERIRQKLRGGNKTEPEQPAEPFVLTRVYEPEDDADDQVARRLKNATARIFDALAFARGPRGELLFMPDDLRLGIAFHAARAGMDQFDDLAVIKARALPDRPGQLAGVVDWVPIDSPDDPAAPERITAVGPLPETPDLEAMNDRVPWHTDTKIEGDWS